MHFCTGNVEILKVADLCEVEENAVEGELDPLENACSALLLCVWQSEQFTYKNLKVNEHVWLLGKYVSHQVLHSCSCYY